jgi:hypothetical protein
MHVVSLMPPRERSRRGRRQPCRPQRIRRIPKTEDRGLRSGQSSRHDRQTSNRREPRKEIVPSQEDKKPDANAVFAAGKSRKAIGPRTDGSRKTTKDNRKAANALAAVPRKTAGKIPSERRSSTPRAEGQATDDRGARIPSWLAPSPRGRRPRKSECPGHGGGSRPGLTRA